MKSKPRILIYDDEAQFVAGLETKLTEVPEIKRTFQIDRLSDGDFVKVLHDFKTRQEKFRQNAEWDDEPIPLDDAAILIVDYDLLKAPPNTQSVLTGEEFAYLARVFSSCQIVAELNQFGTNTFDLRLRGYPDSFADLNLGDKQIDNPYLWGAKKAKRQFAPWCWPNISVLLDDFALRVADMESGLQSEESLAKILGLTDEVFEHLPRSLAEFLGVHGSTSGASGVSVFEFLTESRNVLRPKDAAALKGHRKALAKGTHRHSKILARVAAARLSKWIECLLIPGQDIVVDAPHLASRYPSLLKTKTPTLAVFDKTAQIAAYDKLGLDTARIEKYRLERTHWFSRPLWLWTQLREDQDISEIEEPWTIRKKLGDLVFCEDISTFAPRGECREFYADSESPFAKRFVKVVDQVDYKPRVWFS